MFPLRFSCLRVTALFAVLQLLWCQSTHAQVAYWSLQGEFQNATDSIELHFDLVNSVSSADTFYGATFGHSGVISNLVGDSIAPGGFDPILELFDVAGGGQLSLGSNDDGFASPNRDAFLTWPGVAVQGGSIGTDPLPVGNYRMDMTAWQAGYPGGTSPWALDLRGPGFNEHVSPTGITATGGATIQSLKFGGDSSIAAILDIEQPSTTITDELVVGANGSGALFVNTNTTLNTTGSTLVGGSGGKSSMAVFGPNAVWNANLVNVGDPSVGVGNGSINVYDQARVASGDVRVAEIATNGVFTDRGSRIGVDGFVEGLGLRARWDITGKLDVGSTGPESGAVYVADGGIMTVSQDANVMGSTGATGTIAVGSGGQLDVAGVLNVGSDAEVELTGFDSQINTGSFIVDPQGTFTHEDGTLTVDGGQFTMEIGALVIDGVPGGGLPNLRLDNGAQGSVEFQLGVTPPASGFYVGQDGNGRMEILNGSKMTSDGGLIGRGTSFPGAGQGHVLVEGSGSVWEITGGPPHTGGTFSSLLVGPNGQGTLEILDGAQVFVRRSVVEIGSPSLSVGSGHGGPGVAIVDGQGSLLRAEKDESFEGDVSIGALDPATGSSGALIVSNHGRVEVENAMYVESAGSLALKSGGEIHTNSFFVFPNGTYSHEDGTLTVDGGTFFPGTTGYSIGGVAPGDEPTVELVAGATASFTDLVRIGEFGDAALRVIGAGGNSRFEAAHDIMDVGFLGAGRLEILEGGAVDHTGTFVFNLGVAAGSSGNATVDGPGSALSTGGLLIVGDHGRGQLDITGGGQVTANRTWIAHFSDAQPSQIFVDGTSGAPGNAPSTLQVGGDLFVSGDDVQGSGIAGNLTVGGGGLVSVLSTLKVWPNGTVELHNGSIFAADVDLAGGRLEGNGEVVVGPVGSAINSGSVAPGLSPGALTISGSDYVQTANGTLEIEIGGTDPAQFDQLHVERGAAILDGILDVSLLNPFSPHAGDSFEILSAEDGLSGTFSTENLPALTGQLFWTVDYETVADVVVLEVFSPFTADFDLDGDVDDDDLAQWEGDFGVNGDSDADGDGDSDGADFFEWQRQLGGGVPIGAKPQAVPEPGGAVALVSVLAGGLCCWRDGR